MVDLKDFREKEMLKTITQGIVKACREFIAAQQKYIAFLLKRTRN